MTTTTSRMRGGLIKRGATWSYMVRVSDPATGLTRQRWVGGFPTEAAAKAARDEARVAARKGAFVDRSRITLGRYLDGWLDGHAMAVKPSTLHNYRGKVRLYIKPALGSMPVQQVRPATLSRLYRDLLDHGGRDGKPVSPATVQYVAAILHRALKDAVQVDRLIPANPAEQARRPKARRSEPVVWGEAEVSAFLKVAQGHRLGALYRVAAYTGARRGEILNMRWADLDMDGGTVTFRGTVNVIDRKRVEGSTKGDRSRVVRLDSGTITVLREHRKAQMADRLRLGEAWRGDGTSVFVTEWGDPIFPNTPTSLMGRLCREAGVPRARLHDLRHSHATILLRSGVPLHVVAQRLGHKDAMVTATIYAHVLGDQAAEVADVFAERLAAVR